MDWKRHGSYGGKIAEGHTGLEWVVIPNAETSRWEVFCTFSGEPFGEPLASWHPEPGHRRRGRPK